jgi:hypothetical protein
MSKSFNARFDYDVAFSHANVAQVLRVLAESIDENWQTGSLRDQWSTSEPDLKVDTDTWLAACEIGRMNRFVGDDGRPFHATAGLLDAEFSPLSTYACSYIIGSGKQGMLYVELLAWRGVLGETAGDREQGRMEAPWDDVRRQRPVRSHSSIGPDEDDPTFDAWWEKWNALEDTPPVWPQNKRAIQNIISTLRSVHPVRSASIDSELQG